MTNTLTIITLLLTSHTIPPIPSAKIEHYRAHADPDTINDLYILWTSNTPELNCATNCSETSHCVGFIIQNTEISTGCKGITDDLWNKVFKRNNLVYGYTIGDTAFVNADPCKIRNGECQQKCKDIEGTASCSCKNGYALRPDNTTCASICESGWKYTNKRCYLIVKNTNVSWADADAQCVERSAELANVKTESLNKFIMNKATKNMSVWLGGSDGEVEGDWRWMQDYTAFSAGFTNWFTGEPNNTTSVEDCLSMSMTIPDEGKWFDEACDTPVYGTYVCEKDGVYP